MTSGRMRRVDEAMRAVLSDVIASDLKDPRIGFVTVTGVKTSPDLRHARVYVSVLGDDHLTTVAQQLLEYLHCNERMLRIVLDQKNPHRRVC